MGSNRESQLDVHAGRITLDRRIDKLTNFGELDDFLHFGIYFRTGHAEDCTVEVNIFTTGHFTMEAGAHFQHGSHTTIEVDFAFRRCRDLTEELQQGALTSTVASDDAHCLTLVNGQINAVERHKGFAIGALIHADHGVGIFLAPLAGPPALQISR